MKLENGLGIFFDYYLFNGDDHSYKQWLKSYREDFSNWIRYVLLFGVYFFILMFFFVDQDKGIFWHLYRLVGACFFIAMIICYQQKIVRQSSFFKMPIIIFLFIFSYFQTLMFLESDNFNIYYNCISIFIILYVLDLSLSSALLFNVLLVLFEYLMISDQQLSSLLLTKFLILCFFSLMLFISRRRKVLNFLSNIRNIKIEKEINGVEKEFRETLYALFPKVITQKLVYEIEKNNQSVLQAIQKVLMPQKKEVVCLYSDIRSYTKQSNSIENYAIDLVIPNIRILSETIEDYMGIPKKIGDLLLAYFDSDFLELNQLRGLLSAQKLIGANREYNEKQSGKHPDFSNEIRRYALLSLGEATVGNVSGYDSSIEITVLGSVVNYLSRLDEITKDSRLQKELFSSDIILCERFSLFLNELGVKTKKINLKKKGILIRDFEEINEIYTVAYSDELIVKLETQYQERIQQLERNFKEEYYAFIT